MTSNDENTFRSSTLENDGISLAAGSTITFHMGNGTDTSTDRYLNLPKNESYGLEFIPTTACSVTKINGRTLKTAKTIGTGGWFEPNAKISSFTVYAGSATTVEVGGKC